MPENDFQMFTIHDIPTRRGITQYKHTHIQLNDNDKSTSTKRNS